jgi:O-antigen ligase/Flp pilus assembly protein TadD
MVTTAARQVSRGAVLLAGLAMAYSVLSFSQSFLFCFPPPKTAAAAVFGFLALALAASSGSLRRAPFAVPLAGLAAWLAVDWARGSAGDRYATYLAVPLAAAGVAWVVSSLSAARRNQQRFIAAFVLTHLVCGFYAVIQYYRFDPFTWALDYGPGRVFATMGNPNFLAGQMVLALPVLAVLGTTGAGALRWTARAAFLACFLALVFSQTRGAWLGLAGGTALAAAAWLTARRALPSPRTLAWAFGAAVLFTGIFSFPSASRTGLSVPSQLASSVNLDQQSARRRFFWWRSAAGMFADAPVAGHGTGNFIRDFPVYSARYSGKWSDLEPAYADHPHNDPLYILCEHGVAGLGLLLWLAVWWGSATLREVRRGSLLHLGLLAGVSGLAVHSIWNMPSTIQGTVMTTALLLGLSSPSGNGGEPRLRIPVLAAGIILAAALSFRPVVQLLAQWYYNDGRLLKEDKQNGMAAFTLRKTLALTSAQWRANFMLGTVLYGAGYFSEARKAFEADEKENPWGADAVLHQGKCLREQGDFAGAERLARRSLEILPNYPDAALTLASMAYQDAGKARQSAARRSALARARRWLTFALRFSPRHPEALKLLGHVEIMDRNWQAAYDAWKKSLEARPNDDALRYRMEALGNDLPRLLRGGSAAPKAGETPPLRGGQPR